MIMNNNFGDIYLDNSATTKLSPNVITRMSFVMQNVFGNPSSLHRLGSDAEKILRDSRVSILNALTLNPNNASLVFTGSGTEANNLAIFGTAYAKNRKVKRIIASNSEHLSILEPLKKLQSEGFDVVLLSSKNGIVNVNDVIDSVNSDTILISVMLVNNETGALYDVKNIFTAAKKINPNIITHCDAVQGFFKVKFTAESIGADLISISSHKIHAPKGVGALYISKPILTAKKIVPFILGGGQENGLRSGTENLIGIAGFAEALNNPFDPSITSDLRQYIISNLPTDVKTNIPSGSFAPHILNITLPHVKSEVMLHFLSAHNIFVSSGSACASHSNHRSYVLRAFGLTDNEADSSLRISLDDSISIPQLDFFINTLNQGLIDLIHY